MTLKSLLLGSAFAALAAVNLASAQQAPAATSQSAPIKRTPLQKFDVPGTGSETVIGMAEIVPHVHDQSVTVLCGVEHRSPRTDEVHPGKVDPDVEIWEPTAGKSMTRA